MRKITILLIAVLLVCINVLYAQHLKKNGAPDMRYKENKPGYSPSSSTSVNFSPPSTSNNYTTTQHIKKDGTPDKRFKENSSSSFSSIKRSTSYPKYYKTSTPVPKFENNGQYPYTVKRDANGKIKRSEAAKLAFMRQTSFPHGRPGYVIDHVKPLKRGGCDCLQNMQWQTIAEAKAKDKWE